MLNVDATIAAITAGATDPNRNPNVNDPAPGDRIGEGQVAQERARPGGPGQKTPIPTSRSLFSNVPGIRLGSPNQRQDQGDCPCEALRETTGRNTGPFDNCSLAFGGGQRGRHANNDHIVLDGVLRLVVRGRAGGCLAGMDDMPARGEAAQPQIGVDLHHDVDLA